MYLGSLIGLGWVEEEQELGEERARLVGPVGHGQGLRLF